MPRLIERLRGKSGDDLLNEVKSAFDTDRRMFFDRPAWSDRNPAFPRGFPFSDDDDDIRPRRARWDDPRGRRPTEFGSSSFDAHHDPPGHSRPAGFGSDGSPVFDAHRDNTDWEEEELSRKRHKSPGKPAHAPGLKQHGLRNTVPLAQPQDSVKEESQRTRAMSAPPGDRPQRFVSSCEIPVQQPAGQPQATAQPQQQHQQQQTQGSNVRVIPIQVEGRAEPLVNKNIDTSNFASERPPSFDGRLPRDFGPYRKHSARFGASQSPPSFGAPHSPPPAKKPPPKPQPQQQQQQQDPIPQPPPMQKTNTDEVDRGAPAPPPPPPADPTTVALARVAEVQKEVDALAEKVEVAKPSSRKDREYMYLDEMLTRELIKLDDIDTAGQDSVRQARKDAIRSIQKCISVLESKVPGEPMEVVAEDAVAAGEPMTDEPVEQGDAVQTADVGSSDAPVTATGDPPT